MSRRRRGEGTFLTRPDGRIMYQVLVNGRRLTTYGRNKTEAKAKADEKVALLGDVRSVTTISDLLDAWKSDGFAAHRLAPSTFDQYLYLLGGKVVPGIGTKRVDAVTKRIVADVLRDLTGSASSRRSTYAAMVKLMEYAKDRGIVGANVMREVKRPQAASTAARDISTDDALRLLAAARGHRWEVAVWLGLGAGMRRGEILGLMWDDVDLTAGEAHVLGNVTRSSAGLRRGDPKTRRGKRIVPLPSSVIAALKSHRKSQAIERLAAGSAWTDSGHVLTNEIGGVGEPRKLSRVWASWARSAKVADQGTHVGRHFAASNLLASGRASVADVAAMLGHDPSVLLSTYAVAVADGQRAAASALGDLLSTPRKVSKR